jgi:predicted ArsR family transcriptional regulator
VTYVDRDHELTVVLADGTRYRIYRCIAEHPSEAVTVADVAQRFGLHPNVARMHLVKLEQAGFLTTTTRRCKGGGRPAKLYSLSDQVSTFGFPPRHYELLSRMTRAVLGDAGAAGGAEHVCREIGRAEGRRYLLESGGGQQLDASASVEAVQRVSEDQGLLADITLHGNDVLIDIHNCVFRELSGAQPDLVCGMHRAFFEGAFEVVLAGMGEMTFSASTTSISRGSDCCHLTCGFAGEPAR